MADMIGPTETRLYAFLKVSPGWWSASDLVIALKSRKPKVAKRTVQRALSRLTTGNVVERQEMRPAPAYRVTSGRRFDKAYAARLDAAAEAMGLTEEGQAT